MEKELKFKSNTAGVCPCCGGENLSYEGFQLEGDMAYYPWECEDCHCQGEEWYHVEFSGHNFIDEFGSNIEIDDSMIEEQ